MNDEMYTDIVMQIFSAFYKEDSLAMGMVIESIMKQFEDYDNFAQDALFPGLLFAAMVHMKMMLTTIEEILGLEDGEGIVKYADFYSFFRSKMLEDDQSLLTPEFGGNILKNIRKDLDDFDKD